MNECKPVVRISRAGVVLARLWSGSDALNGALDASPEDELTTPPPTSVDATRARGGGGEERIGAVRREKTLYSYSNTCVLASGHRTRKQNRLTS